MRTDNIRIFAAGTGAITDYYLNQRRLMHTDTQISYEQGFNAAINMQALVQSDSNLENSFYLRSLPKIFILQQRSILYWNS